LAGEPGLQFGDLGDHVFAKGCVAGLCRLDVLGWLAVLDSPLSGRIRFRKPVLMDRRAVNPVFHAFTSLYGGPLGTMPALQGKMSCGSKAEGKGRQTSSFQQFWERVAPRQ
jgi:hypothetical protein